MSTKENKAIVRRWLDGIQKGKLDTLRDVAAPNFVAHLPGVPQPLDIAGNIQVGEVFVNAFPDARITVEGEIAEGDTVATRWTFRGTHTADFQGIPPTGKQVTMAGIDINRIASGKIVEHWAEFDGLGLMQQLGVIPPPGQPR